MSIKDERLKVLEKGIRSTKGFQSWKANFTPASLDSLSDWFKSVIKVRKRSQEEINREKEKLKKPFKNLKIDNETLTGETVSIAFDVGIYLGEVFIRNNKHLSWSIFQKSKTLFCHMKKKAMFSLMGESNSFRVKRNFFNFLRL